MIYNGQLDVIIPYALSEDLIFKLKWHGQKEYQAAPRLVWKVEGD